MNKHRYRTILAAIFGFFLNLLYAIYNGILAVRGYSLWFAVMCAYYLILGSMRFSAILCERKKDDKIPLQTEYFVMKLSGMMLIVLSVVLTSVIYISLSQNIVSKYDKIFMITIATFTFGKITMAIIRAAKHHHNLSPLLATIHSIGYAEVAVSVLTLQQSMLISFSTTSDANTHDLNMITGAAVCLFVLGLGIALLIKKEGRDGNGKVESNKGK